MAKAIVQTTLLDLVRTVNRLSTSDEETVAVVSHLVNSGRVALCGNFAGARIDVSPCASPAYSDLWLQVFTQAGNAARR